MKKSIYLGIILFTGLRAFSQSNTVIPCSTHTPRIVTDSLHNVRTFFQDANLYFLRSSCTDSTYTQSALYNKRSFSSVNAQALIDDLKKKKKTL